MEVYNDDGSSRGFELYEVGPTSEGETGVLSANPIDPTMIILGISASGSASGSSSSGPSGSTAGASSGAAAGSSSSGSSSSSGVGTAGVKVEFFKDKASLKKRLERYDRIKVLKTTKEQDIAIQKESQDRGRNFGKYNLFFNNCVQYSASCLKAGGIKTGTSFIPNRVHTYVEKNNK